MSDILLIKTRGAVTEDIHRGRIAVVDTRGQVAASVGNIDAMTYFRSSSKPFQTLPILMRGLDRQYGLSEREIAIMCGSHAGEPFHLETILSLLSKAGFSEDDLIMNPAYPAISQYREEMIRQNLPPRKALHNCGGKHIALMMLARELGENHRDYWKPAGAAQREVTQTIAAMTEYPAEQIAVGIDGCGVPVFAVPGKNIALAFMHLTRPETIPDSSLASACAALTPIISRNPLMMRGTGYLCSVLNSDPNITAKGGAQGVYGFGLKKEGLGISVKVENGDSLAWPYVVAEILRQLRYDNAETIQKVDALAPAVIKNDNNTPVGEIKSAFVL